MARLRAGVASVVITPPVGYPMHCLGLRREASTGVHDDLRAKALVLDSGEGPLAIVAIDAVWVPAAVAADVRQRVRDLTGISGERVMLACSHDHTTPGFPEDLGALAKVQGYDRYRGAFVDLVAGAVAQAWHRLAPASLGAGEGRLEGWTTNRRHPERPVDSAVGVVRVDGPDGEPLAVVASFGCHALAVGGQYLWWTADFPGYAARVVEDAYPGAAFLFLQGAHGDVLPFDWYFGNLSSRFRATHENARRIGFALGGEVLKVAQGIEPSQNAPVAATSRALSLPARTVPWTAEEAERVVEETVAANPDWESERWTDAVDHGNSANLAPGYYRVTTARLMASLAARRSAKVAAEVQAFRLGDAAVAANSGELFGELGTKIKQGSPFQPTLIASCANGASGYIPARRDYGDLSGFSLRDLVDTVRTRYLYGVVTSTVNPGAGEALVDATGELLRRV